ncbi:MAG: glycine cleavage system protein GcvH [Deltaproteobacteria bacterium]|nr:glycine cleavage system protein GcvH [Deltaproteobacteria bacterium]
MKIPENLRYTKEHEWAKVEGNRAVVGITAFAVDQLGDITLVELPAVGAQIKAGDTIGTVESVKAVSDLYSPLTGKVLEVNAGIDEAPEKVNENPYEDGWMLKIELGRPDEVGSLLDAAAYKAHLANLEE